MPVSSDQPDWSREAKRFWEWQPSRSLLASIRAYQRLGESQRPDRVVRRWTAVMRHRFWSVVTGADIPLNCRLGGGLLLPHPNGIVVHPDAVIGPNCLLFQQVTIGSRGGPAPRLGGHVDVGAGAKVLGGVVVGAHSKIGANAVVLHDVPAGETAIGIPARAFAAAGRAAGEPRPRPGDGSAAARPRAARARRVAEDAGPQASVPPQEH